MSKTDTREAKYVQARIEGHFPKNAAEIAGYPPSVAAKATREVESRVSVQNSLKDAMERAGLTPELLASKLVAGLEATRTLHATKDGEITDTLEVTDYGERRQHIELAAKLRGDLADHGPALSFNIVMGSIPADVASELVLTPGDVIDVDPLQVVETPCPPALLDAPTT